MFLILYFFDCNTDRIFSFSYCNALNLYSGKTQFESRQRHRLLGFRFFVIIVYLQAHSGDIFSQIPLSMFLLIHHLWPTFQSHLTLY
jgi:hypothetical protein